MSTVLVQLTDGTLIECDTTTLSKNVLRVGDIVYGTDEFIIRLERKIKPNWWQKLIG